jgi:hypothetical protein
MTLFGIELRKPSCNELTAAAVMAVGLWLAAVGLARASGHALEAGDAGALLVMSAWGCIGTRLGVRLDLGGRHFAAHVGVAAILLGLYQAAFTLAA